MATLAYKYLKSGELDESEMWWDCALEGGNLRARMENWKFQERLLIKRTDMLDLEGNSSSSKKFGEDLNRTKCDDPVQVSQVSKIRTHWDELQARAAEGHEYAQRICKLMKHLVQGSSLRKSLESNSNPTTMSLTLMKEEIF